MVFGFELILSTKIILIVKHHLFGGPTGNRLRDQRNSLSLINVHHFTYLLNRLCKRKQKACNKHLVKISCFLLLLIIIDK